MASSSALSTPSRADIRAGKQPERFQIQDLAFNFVGYPLEDGSGERDKHQIILARDKTSKNWMEMVHKAQDASDEDPVYRSSMDFTLREQNIASPQAGTAKFLVVGYAKPLLDKKYRTLDKDKGKPRQAVGLTRPDEGDVLPWEDEAFPTCYVVTPVHDTPPEQIQLYVLLCPKSQLCTPYQIAKDDVFYRYEYRDGSTSVALRRRSWNHVVATHSVRAGFPPSLSEKQKTFKRAQNIGKVIVQPNEELATELKMLAAAAQHNPAVWVLRKIQDLLCRVDLDLAAYADLSTNKGLRAFVDNDWVDFTENDAEELVKDVAIKWPDVKSMSVERVMLLKRLISEQDAEIKNFQIKGLIALGVGMIAKLNGEPIMDETHFVRELVEHLDLILGEEAVPKSTVSNCPDDAPLEALL